MLKENFIQSLTVSLGVITMACRNTGVRYEYYKKWRAEDEDFDYACERIQEESIDFVESRLYKLIQEGDRTAIIFFLKCRRPEKWNDRAGQQVNINIMGTEFQIGNGELSIPNLLQNNNNVEDIEYTNEN